MNNVTVFPGKKRAPHPVEEAIDRGIAAAIAAGVTRRCAFYTLKEGFYLWTEQPDAS